MNKKIVCLHQVNANQTGRYRLICFPHAGGLASFFRSWGEKLIDVEIYAVCYPGRAQRIAAPLPTNVHAVSAEIARAIASLIEKPTLFFGHSMGAAIALETARAVESQGGNIFHLFASGSRHGVCRPNAIQEEEESDERICQQLVEMGGTDLDLIKDPIFCELVLPAIRSDSRMFHAYQMSLSPPLSCPITTIFGDIDQHTDIRPWRDLTTMQFEEKCVPGDHFYLISSPPFSIIQKCLQLTVT